MTDKEYGPIVIGKLMNIGGMLQKKSNQMFAPFDLNQQQFSILFEINRAGRVNQTEMVNKLLLEKAHVSKVIKKLRGLALIEVSVCEEDKRSSWLSITQKGSATVKQCQTSIDAWNKKWLSAVKAEDRQPVLDSVALLQDLFRNNLAE